MNTCRNYCLFPFLSSIRSFMNITISSSSTRLCMSCHALRHFPWFDSCLLFYLCTSSFLSRFPKPLDKQQFPIRNEKNERDRCGERERERENEVSSAHFAHTRTHQCIVYSQWWYIQLIYFVHLSITMFSHTSTGWDTFQVQPIGNQKPEDPKHMTKNGCQFYTTNCKCRHIHSIQILSRHAIGFPVLPTIVSFHFYFYSN